ncbi:uncharacterized protein APUU_11685S [Aspergillus puulaauensis]|uniref:BHLH domain-containing protein n=1 Tax=Aspergillus puulaauensis TaxID=1220207 RepID=A0A7R7XCE7_9EURO|nr:uncharacterized protein APUU_11685S [Aspergillus puulaauensis]BCS18857.1 hypothetical protein APUU_11685S [Aspergillus puulaauensis]
MSPRAPGNNMNLQLHGAAAPVGPVAPAGPAGPAGPSGPAPAFPASPFVPQQALLSGYQQDMAPQLDPSMSESPLSMKSEIMTPDVSMADLLSLPESTLPQSAIPTENMQHSFMPDGTIPNGIMPHDLISKGALPHDMISNGMVPDGTMPDMMDPQMNRLEGLQGLPGVPTYTDEYPSSNHEQAWFQCSSGGLGSSDLSRAQSLDIDSNSPGTIHSFGSMQAPLMGFTSPMPVQIHLQHAPAPYPMSPRPGSNRIICNNRSNRNRYTPAQYGRGISGPVPGLESHASPRTNAELEQEARHAQRRKSHNSVEKRYRHNLNAKYLQLDSAISRSACSFPVAGGSCPGSEDKVHSQIAPSDQEAEAAVKKKGGQRASQSKAGVLAGAIARLQQMADEIHMLKLKVAMCEASRVADSQQVHDGVDAEHGDEDKDAPHDVEDV